MKRWLWVAVAAVAVFVVGAMVLRWRIQSVQREVRQEVVSRESLPFDARAIMPEGDGGFEWLVGPSIFTAAARFQDHLYLAGSEGLFEYELNGRMSKEFRIGRELPRTALTCLATAMLADAHGPELLIGTDGEGLLAFDGNGFRQIAARDPLARTLTALLPLENGTVLMGTSKRGVLAYDGHRLHSFHETLARAAVTALAGNGSDLWVGTQEQGVLHWSAGTMTAMGEADGLPDARVNVIALAPGRAYVATPAGVAELRDGKFARVIAAGVFARSLLAERDGLYIGTEDQGVVHVPLVVSVRSVGFGRAESGAETLVGAQPVQQILRLDGQEIYALMQGGMFQHRAGESGWSRVLGAEPEVLSDGNISALAVDKSGRLFVGYFDHGLDELDPSLRRKLHLEDDQVFCVNRIIAGASPGVTAVATSNGLVLFDELGRKRQILRKADGLMADAVTDVAPLEHGMAVATPAGLTIFDENGARGMNAFHGLVNNHLYALGVRGRKMIAGTLGGFSVLEGDRVMASFNTSNSGLKHNWTTAVAPVANEWFVGTYGAGVMKFDGTKVEPFDFAMKGIEVNDNTILITQTHVLAGTTRDGLLIFDRESQRWHAVMKGLPSSNVTALAEHEGTLYIGTSNGLVRIREGALRP